MTRRIRFTPLIRAGVFVGGAVMAAAAVRARANASAQFPNQFRVTHLALGSSATLAEDRTYDIPLRPACPADVSSSVLGPITPVELMEFRVE